MGLFDFVGDILGTSPDLPDAPENPLTSTELGKETQKRLLDFFKDPRSSQEFALISGLATDAAGATRRQARTAMLNRLGATAGLTGGARARAELGAENAADQARAQMMREFLLQLFRGKEATAASLLGGSQQFQASLFGTQTQGALHENDWMQTMIAGGSRVGAAAV